jgi:hypothetical protein
MPSAAGTSWTMSENEGLGISKLGNPAGDLPDLGNAVRGEVERPGECDRRDDNEQRCRQLRYAHSQREQDRKRHCAYRDRRTAGLAEFLDHLPELRQRVGRVDRQAEKLPELTDDQDDRDAVDVPDEDRPGEVVGDPAQAQHARGREADRDQQGEHRRQSGRVGGTGSGERQDRGRHERGDRALGSDDELPR